MALQQLGKFELQGLVGSGGMGSVYRAYDTELDRTVALKLMNAGLGDGEDAVKRFKDEARNLAQLDHPNIVTIYDFPELEGYFCLIMQLIDGEPLSVYIDEPRPMALAQKLRLMAQVCRALHYAHSRPRPVIHRDIKPPNILVQPDLSPKIVDFGIAKMMDDKSVVRASTTMGTFAYMSPEQIDGKPLNGQTDIFSAGVVLYELLTGVCPFQGQDTTATMKRILMDPAPPIGNYLGGLPPSLHTILDRALAKNLYQRYATAADFAFDLEQTVAVMTNATPVPGPRVERKPTVQEKVPPPPPPPPPPPDRHESGKVPVGGGLFVARPDSGKLHPEPVGPGNLSASADAGSFGTFGSGPRFGMVGDDARKDEDDTKQSFSKPLIAGAVLLVAAVVGLVIWGVSHHTDPTPVAPVIISDDDIANSIRQKFQTSGNPDLNSGKLQVAVAAHNVALSGTVSSVNSRAQAEDLARSVGGFDSFSDLITVQPPVNPKPSPIPASQPQPTPQPPQPTPQPAQPKQIDTVRLQKLIASGNSAMDRGDYDIAAQFYSQAREIDPNNATATAGLARARSAAAAERAVNP